ncbi:hypothetical protein JQX09_24305 [Sulfitobacter pseudonitzschiae]|uniref:Uncharacterized protein n=1 Tax=Pseudosulfitobacter pseudonitzschiae TaxID=1402135 RepID=A0A9Q2P746_9RHOB|nr:hypothetical protein [Pseudosulfitobacter pseudonitzschiae]MBM2295046.1 hypothetical protein [Pseudosulfitobacter pseudonitzschiae]MBM2299960.1 hypothetical protein [Pseudosulfitobacter pseudonitzschiae]MBM2304884.1 hypothetical protein [Pseudosulfitobacter pseudonitzschiae]MBM2314657.1 hypothetical protein [Pseudosulfitobacter pseudonitzschiae]MBM2319567.1 hypothetical protein [Pseudosulfitobacter pseudonitzschiae]
MSIAEQAYAYQPTLGGVEERREAQLTKQIAQLKGSLHAAEVELRAVRHRLKGLGIAPSTSDELLVPIEDGVKLGANADVRHAVRHGQVRVVARVTDDPSEGHLIIEVFRDRHLDEEVS